MRRCRDRQNDEQQFRRLGRAGLLEASTVRQATANAIVIDSVCTFGAATTTSHAVVNGSFDRAYTVRRHLDARAAGGRLPGVAPGGETHMTIAAKWLGACAAGQQPGDIIMRNGMTMNVLDMQKRGVQPRGPDRHAASRAAAMAIGALCT